VVKRTMEVFIVIGLRDFYITGHKGVGQVAQRVGKHRNTVSEALKGDEWVRYKRITLGDYLIISVSIEKMRDRGSPR